MTTKTKADLEKANRKLEAQLNYLTKQFKTGVYTSWGKQYRGVPLDKGVEYEVTEYLRDLLSNQYDGESTGSDCWMILVDGTHGELYLPEITHYIVNFSHNNDDGTYLVKAYRAVEVSLLDLV